MLKKGILVVLLIFTVSTTVFFLRRETETYEYFKEGKTLEHFNGSQFAGSKTCANCHLDIYEQHIKSAHYLSSTLPSVQTIKGIKEASQLDFNIDDYHRYTVEKKSNQFFQVLINDSLNKKIREDKIDIVIGSGVKGQSFFSWEKDKLYQLQTSYFVPAKQWVNSPGYKNTLKPKERQIGLSCLECHATFAKSSVGSKQNEILKSSIYLGIDCERCHGPSSKHVAHHEKFPNDTLGKFIVDHDRLSRQRRVDLCALCHSGAKTRQPNKEFHYLVGDTLSNYTVNDFRDYYKAKFSTKLDVHGNQVGLLESSLCFQKSNMDCNTCHNAHASERGDLDKFNNICMNCHKQISCSLPMDSHDSNSCVNCHMPVFQSTAMKIQKGDSLINVKVRSHLIKKYEVPSKQLSSYIKKL